MYPLSITVQELASNIVKEHHHDLLLFMTPLVQWAIGSSAPLAWAPSGSNIQWHLIWGLGSTASTRIVRPLHPCCPSVLPRLLQERWSEGSITREQKSNVEVPLRSSFGSHIISSLPHSIKINEIKASTD